MSPTAPGEASSELAHSAPRAMASPDETDPRGSTISAEGISLVRQTPAPSHGVPGSTIRIDFAGSDTLHGPASFVFATPSPEALRRPAAEDQARIGQMEAVVSTVSTFRAGGFGDALAAFKSSPAIVLGLGSDHILVVTDFD
jgi:hypothetical protein